MPKPIMPARDVLLVLTVYTLTLTLMISAVLFIAHKFHF